jgi:predicted ATPase/DNA-binding SARP family transcriptional activator
VVTGITVNVLGPVEVRRRGARVSIDGLKRRQLLAVLVAARGSEVSIGRLGEALWEGEPPNSARASLQSHVSRLRRALMPDAVVRAGGVGYAIDMDCVELDAARFEELTDAATGDERIPLLERALALWRGAAFGEFAELTGVRGEAMRLEELRLTVTERLIEARIDAGEEARVVAELEALVTSHPLREQFWRQLMLALYRSGRQAESLRRCADLRAMLREELGLSLSPAVKELEARILADDPSLRRPVAAPVPATTVPVARREPTQLIGRSGDIAAIREALGRRPIVTVSGPGGVGKSRLATTVAGSCSHRFAQAVVVELAALRDPDATVQLVACALDVEQRQHLTLESTIEEFIHDRPVLLVLDNCEHVLGAVVPLVQRLCRHCPRLSVLATSREPLGLPGELVHGLAPLDVPVPGAGGAESRTSSAVQLFADRAAEARPGFQLDDRNLAAVAEICRRLDGLPLAIELAAARMRSIGVEALAARLDQRFALLTRQRASVEPRHRSLHRLVEWSYELLDAVDQEAFAQLSAFAGSFNLDAAEVVCRPTLGGGEGSARVVIDLVDKSMVQVVDPEEPRYRLLETLREFGHERLQDAGALATVEQRHRGWFLDVAECAAVGLDSPDEGRWATAIDRDLDNVRAAHASAVAAGDLAVAAGLVGALREYSFRRVRYEIATWGEATMQMAGFERSPAAPIVLGVAAYGRWVRGDLDAAIALAHRSIALANELDERSTGLAERVLGNALFYSGATQEALRSMEEMTKAARAGGSPATLTHALYMSSVARTSIGDAGRGAMLSEEAAAAAERCGSPTARAQAAYAHGLALRATDSEQAERALRLAADLGEEAGNRWIRAFALTQVHWLSAHQGRVADALRGFSEVVDLWYRGGDWANQWLSMRHVLGILTDLGAHRAAAVLHGALVAAGAAAALPFEPADAQRLAAEADRIREVLGPAEFAAAVRNGAAKSDADTVAYVQAEIERLLGERPDDGRRPRA